MRYLWLVFLAFFSFAEHIPYDSKGPNKVGYLHIGKERGIDQSTLLYVKYSLDYFREEKVPFIVLHLDTPGGEVFPAMKISELLKEIDAKDHIPVVAFVDNWAISAGAMLAYSCRYIGITKSASMGAAEPVIMGAGEVQSASEKMNSALRAEFANLANYWGRNADLAEAMVDKDIILVFRGDKVVRLQEESQIGVEDEIIIKKGKLLTLTAQQLERWGVADFQAESVLEHPFFAKIPDVKFIEYRDWKITFFSFLMHPMVSSLLSMGLLLGLYMQAQNPGGLFSALLAASCLGLTLLSSFAIEAARFMEIILLVAGIGLLVLEFFILPGLGIPGILGIAATMIAFLALGLPGFENLPLIPWVAITSHLAWLCGAVIIAVAIIFMLAPKMLKRFALIGDQGGFLASSFDTALVGKSAITLSDLNPSGHILVDGKPMQAISETGFIDKDSGVEVTGGRGANLLVKHKEKLS